jgi:hypothetical protein
MVKTREQIQKINETVNKLHASTVSISNSRQNDKSGEFAKRLVEQADKIEK